MINQIYNFELYWLILWAGNKLIRIAKCVSILNQMRSSASKQFAMHANQ